MLRGGKLTKTVRITARILLILGVFSFVFGNFSQNIQQFKPKEAEASIGGAYATRLWSSGFELQSTTAGVEYTNNVTNTPSINTSTFRSGAASMRTNASAQVMGAEYDWATADNATRTTYRAYIRVASAPAAETGIMSFFDVGNTRQISIRMNTDLTLELWNEEDTAQIGSASSALATNTWYRVELQYDFGTAATGDSIARARLNGVEFASSTTVNHANGAMTFQWGVLTSTTADFYWDDLAVNQDVAGATVNNWVGEGKIVHLKPNGNGANTAWTGDYTAVDEVTPNDGTDYINCTATSQNEDYTLEDFTTLTGVSHRSTIRIIQPNVRVSDAGTGGATYTIGVLESGGGVDTSAAVTINIAANTWNTNDDSAPKNPKLSVFNQPGATSAKLTPNMIDGMSLRIGSSTDCTPNIWISTAWLMVEYATEGGRVYSSGVELQSLTSGMEWDTTAGTMAIDTTTKRSGLASLRIHSLVSTTEESMSETVSPVNDNGPFYLRTYLRVATNPSADNRIIEFKNSSATVIAYMVLSSTGTLKLFDEDGQVGSDSSAISTNTWYRIEMQVDARGAGATDTVEARIDGTNFASSTTRDLSTGVDKFLLGGNLNGEAQTQGDWYFDDIALNNGSGTTQTGYPGAGSIVHMQPDADGDTVSWTNTFTNIDEVTPDNGTTLITTSTANAVEEANLESSTNAGIDAQSVTLVSVGVRANRSTTAESSIAVRLKDGASGPYIESSEIRLLNTTYFTNDSTASSNWYPLTAYNPPMLESAWSTGKLDTMQVGVRQVLDTTGNSQVSALWALVEFIPTVYTVSGICKQYDKTTNCSDGLSVKASVNGSGPTTGTTSGGTFSVNLSAKPNMFESVHVYLDGVASTDRANAVTVYDGNGNITGVQLIFRTLSIGSDDGTTPGWGELDNWDNSTSGDADVFFDVDGSGVLTVDSGAAYTDERLLIVNGGTFQTNQTVNTHDIEVYGGLTIETGTTLNVNGSYYNDATTGIATFQSASTLNMTSTSTGELFTSGGDALVNLTFNGIGGGWTLQDDITLSGTFTITNGNLNASSRTITLSSTGTPFVNNGTFTYSTSTVLYTGNGATNIAAINMSNASGGTNGYYNLRVEPAGGTAHTLGTAGSQTIGVAGNLTIGNGTNAGSTAATNNPTITVAGNMTIAAGATFTTGNSPLTVTGNLTVSNTGSTGTISGTGTGDISVSGDVTGGGTINISGNTFKQVVSINEIFGSNANSNNWTFNNLSFENSGAADRTITTASGGSGQIIVNGTLTVGNAGNSFNTVIDNDTNDRIFDLNGTTSINITSKGSFTMSNSASFTVADDFTNNGTFTATSGSTVTFDTTTTATITGATTFYNLTAATATKQLQFITSTTYTINGLLTLTGVTVTRSGGSGSWTINHQGTESISSSTISWSACSTSPASTQIDALITNGNSDGGNNGTCWVFSNGVTLAGIVYLNDESSADVTGYTIRASINGGTATNGTSDGSGVFSFTTATVPNAGDFITLWLDTNGGNRGSLILKYGTSCTGNPDCTGLKIVRDQVRIENFNSGVIITSDLANCDNDTGTGCTDTDIGFTSNGSLFTVSSNWELKIASTATFGGSGLITAPKLDIAGTYSGGIETLSLNGAGTSGNCTDSTAVPLCITGSFTPNANTVSFTSTSATSVNPGTFNNLSLLPAGTVTYTPLAGTFTVGGNLIVGNSTNALTFDVAANDPTITVTGNSTIAATSIFSVGDNPFSTAGNLTVTGTLSGSGSGTITVNGSVSGAGVINLNGNTFEHRVSGASKTFGGGSALTWTATELTMQSGSGNQRITSIIYDRINLRFLAAGYDQGLGKVIVWEATDPASWTPHDVETSGSPTTGQIFHDTANGKYLVTGTKSTDATVWESTDLTTWTARTIYSAANNQNANDIIYQNGTYVVAGNSDQSGNVDGYIWTATSLSGSWTSNLLATGSSYDNVSSVMYNPYDKLYVAVGEIQSGMIGGGASYVWESTDLSSWTPRLVEDTANIQAAYWIRYDKTLGKYLVYGINDATGGFQFDQVLWSATSPSSTWTKTNIATTGTFESIHGRISFNPATGRDVIPGNWNSDAVLWESTAPTTSWNTYGIDTDSAKQDAFGLVYDPINGRFIAGGIDQTAGTGDDAVIWYTNPSGWRFNNLTFGNTTGSSYTITTNGNVPFYVTGNLTVGKSGDTGTTTLDNETNDKGFTVEGNLTINSTGVLQASSTIPLTVGGSWSNSGTFTANSGTVVMNAITTGKTISGTLTGSTGKFNDLTFDGLGGGWTMSNNSELAGNLTIHAGTLSLGSTTITIAGSSPINAVSSNLNFGTSTVVLTTGTSITVPNLTYYNLELKPGTNSTTYTLPTGTFAISNDLTLGNGSNTSIVITADTNDPIIDVNGSLTINASTTFTASNSQDITVAKSWTNGGTFTHSSRTVTLDGSATGQTITANNASGIFNNLNISGSGSWTVSTNAMQVIGNLTVNTGTLQGAQNVTVNGALTGTGTINMSGGTVENRVAANQNFGTPSGSSNWTFNNLTFGNSSGATKTVTFTDGTGTLTISGVLAIGKSGDTNSTVFSAGNRAITLSGSGTPISILASPAGTFTNGTSTVTYTSSSGVTALSSTAMTGSNAFNNLVINASAGNPTFTMGVAVTVSNDLTVTAGTLAGTHDLTVNGGDITGNGTINLTNGTTTLAGTGNFGGNSDWTFAALTFGSGSGATTAIGSGKTVTTGILAISASHTLNAGAKVWEVNNSSLPFSINIAATFNANTSTFEYRGGHGANIENTTYYNLTVAPNGDGLAHLFNSGTLTVQNNLIIGNGTNTGVTVDANSADPVITVNGNMTISSGAIFQASNTNNLTIGGNFTNNGTFTHNNGTVVINPTGTTSQINGTTTPTNFYNLTMSPPTEKTIQFGNGSTYGFAGTVTIGGSSGVPVNIASDSAGVRWNINLTGTAVINYAYIKDSGCAGGTNTVILGQNAIDGSNNGACWRFIIRNGGSNIGENASGGGAGQSGGGQGGGSFASATGTAILSNNTVASVTINSGGSNYVSSPNVCFVIVNGGSGAVGTVTISNGSVTLVTITNGGSGYISAPTVVFQGGNTPDPAPACSTGQSGGGQGGGGGGGSP